MYRGLLLIQAGAKLQLVLVREFADDRRQVLAHPICVDAGWRGADGPGLHAAKRSGSPARFWPAEFLVANAVFQFPNLKRREEKALGS